VLLKKGVLLLNPIPWLFSLDIRMTEDPCCIVPVVRRNRLAIRRITVTHDQDVLPLPEWVSEDGLRVEDDFTVVTGSLTGAGAIKVPLWKLAWVINRSRQRLIRGSNHKSQQLSGNYWVIAPSFQISREGLKDIYIRV
jgi:hypothetical protein